MYERRTFIYAHIIKHLFHGDPRAPCYLLKQGIFLKLINKLIEVDLIHMLKTLRLASQNSWIDFLTEPFAWLWPRRPVIAVLHLDLLSKEAPILRSLAQKLLQRIDQQLLFIQSSLH